MSQAILKQNKSPTTHFKYFFLMIAILATGLAITLFFSRLDNILPIRTVRVEGIFQYTEESVIQNIVTKHLNKNILSIDSEEIKVSLEKLPLVKQAAIRRVWPDEIIIQIEEYKPIAYFGDSGYVHDGGLVVQTDLNINEEFPEFEGKNQVIPAMLSIWEYYTKLDFANHWVLDKLICFPNGTWQIKFRGGITVNLGREAIKSKLARLDTFYHQLTESQILQIARIDMRYHYGIAVTWRQRS